MFLSGIFQTSGNLDQEILMTIVNAKRDRLDLLLKSLGNSRIFNSKSVEQFNLYRMAFQAFIRTMKICQVSTVLH